MAVTTNTADVLGDCFSTKLNGKKKTKRIAGDETDDKHSRRTAVENIRFREKNTKTPDRKIVRPYFSSALAFRVKFLPVSASSARGAVLVTATT